MVISTTASKYRHISQVVAIVGFVAFLFADIEISNSEPYGELVKIFGGLISPDLSQTEFLFDALITTIAFALIGLTIAASVGLALSPYHHFSIVSHCCAFVRSIHELFWALIFLQMFGLSSITGVLAIAIPYIGIFTRVFDDLLSQSGVDSKTAFCPGTSRLSAWVYGPVALCWPALVRYTRYRFECALRSATVLGFIGLPTLGYYLETAFSQGLYQQAGGLLLLFFGLIASIKWWLKRWLIPCYILAALMYLPWESQIEFQYLWRFLSQDLTPTPFRAENIALTDVMSWFSDIFYQQILLGGYATLLLSVAALLLCAVVSLALWPLASKTLMGRGYALGHGVLIVLRSTPELIITFIVMLVIGPSMLPAIIALALHNGGIIAYLLARSADQVELRADKSKHVDLWAYELQPHLYPSFIAFIFYRFEVILRESAILGMLGVTTLGFYIDSAFEAMYFDVALVLILVTALLNIGVNYLSLRLRRYLALDRLVLV